MRNYKPRIILIVSLIISFGVLTVLTLNGAVGWIERGVYKAISGHMSAALTSGMIAVSNSGSFAAVAAILALLCLLPFTRSRLGGSVAVGVMISAGLNYILKAAIARDRPDVLRLAVESGYGFPSGHAMNNAALYTMITLAVFRRTKNIKIRAGVLLISAAIVSVIGVSRIYLGVHNAGDVLAGWIMGVTVALATDMLWPFARGGKLAGRLGKYPQKAR